MNRYDIAMKKPAPESAEHVKVLQRDSEARSEGSVNILSAQSLDDIGAAYGLSRHTETDDEFQSRLIATVKGQQNPPPGWGAKEAEVLRSTIEGVPTHLTAPVIRPDRLHMEELSVEVVIPDEMTYGGGRAIDTPAGLDPERMAHERAQGLMIERLNGYITYTTREEASQFARILRASIYIAT